MANTIRLFVYGSLKRGFRHHDWLSSAELEAAPAKTQVGYGLVRLGEYPALHTGAAGRVDGELYRVSPELLSELDTFEGCPELYQRACIVVDDGSTAIAYVISCEQAEQCEPIRSGRWEER
jgi:gamma-glutamylcyclotransferase (GGCT)/AIG2-like uncharacterized protein YtfP